MREYLERLHSRGRTVTAMTYEDAIARAELAASFVSHPYWEVVSGMLAGTIKAETEELLLDDKHAPVNRASVAICRKVLQAPSFDIEQGRLADEYYRKAKGHIARRSVNQSGSAPREV